MSTRLTLKPGEIVSEPGIYEVRKSNWRISLTKPLTPKLGEEWERVIDALHRVGNPRTTFVTVIKSEAKDSQVILRLPT